MSDLEEMVDLLRQKDELLAKIARTEKRIALERAPQPELMKEFVAFVDAFSKVFHDDWEHTERCLADKMLINGTFLEPNVPDLAACNWTNREILLDSYRRTVALMRKNGLDLIPAHYPTELHWRQ